MLTRTKWILAGLATALLVGTAYAAAVEDPTDADGDAADAASYRGGHWHRDNGTVTGDHVSFGYDPATGALSDYTADGKLVFTSVTLGSYDASDAKARAHGRVLLASDGDLARVMVFDARNAALHIASPAGNTVTFVVADGIGVEYHAGEADWSPEGVLLRDGNQTARITVDGQASSVNVTGQVITVTLNAAGHLGFRVDGHPRELAKERLAMMKLKHHMKEHKAKHEKRDEKRAERLARKS